MTNFTEKQKNDVWGTANEIYGKNPDTYRKDPYGNIIMRSKHGENTDKGWEIDHIIPKAVTDYAGMEIINDLWNLQALQSGLNSSKGKLPNKMTRYRKTALEFCKSQKPALAKKWEEYLKNQ